MKRIAAGLFACCLVLVVFAARTGADTPSLDSGYRLMYGFDFPSADREFREWRTAHPGDPLGPVSQAASLLFAELDRLHVLQAQFFTDDASFTSGKAAPDVALRSRFFSLLDASEALARTRLAHARSDQDGLFAMALVNGLHADYAALVEGRNFSSLGYTSAGARWARQLLAVAPDCADAYLATGISEYIVGSIPAPARWLLRVAGYAGNKNRGLEQLHVTAERGHLLAPLARILLAIAYLRDGERPLARQMLAALRKDFPSNPLFARELKRLDAGGH